MKALSIKQPWAGLILLGIKPVENRTWATKYRGKFIIHAGQKVDKAMMAVVDFWSKSGSIYSQFIANERHRVGEIDWREIPAFKTGSVCGTAHILDCDESRPSGETFYDDCGYWWHLSSPMSFNKAIPYKGRLGLFNIPESVIMQGYELSCDQIGEGR